MRLRSGIVVIALVPLLTGCATLRATIDGWTGGPGGLTRSQRVLREALARQDYPAALSVREDDDLLRLLTTGAATFYASQYARSAALLDTAALVVDERLTSSVSRNGLALVTNDMARPYQLRRTERLFVPYYGMLAYARLAQWEDAAVEARRMSALLAADRGDLDDAERALHASLQYLVGAVFECTGERDDALVAYRAAHALVDAYPEHPAPLRGDDGSVLVVVERGFVAHRATETIRVPLGADDREAARRTDGSRPRFMEQVTSVLSPSAGPALAPAPASAVPAFGRAQVVAPPRSADVMQAGAVTTRAAHANHGGDDDLHFISLAFPALHRSPRPWAGAPWISADLADSSSGAPLALDVRVAASVDDASAVDERRERAAVIARELARAAAKYAVGRAVEDRRGEVAGRLAEAGANLLERADVRSWHVLPQQVVLIRARLPAGQHQLTVDVGDGASARRVPLGTIQVKRGAGIIATARFWREPAFASAASCAPHAMACRQ